jgi:hypothetical protein
MENKKRYRKIVSLEGEFGKADGYKIDVTKINCIIIK